MDTTQGTPVSQVPAAPSGGPPPADSPRAIAALRAPSELAQAALPAASPAAVVASTPAPAPVPAPESTRSGGAKWIVAILGVLALALFHPSAVAATERFLPPSILLYDTFLRCALLAGIAWYLLEGDPTAIF